VDIHNKIVNRAPTKVPKTASDEDLTRLRKRVRQLARAGTAEALMQCEKLLAPKEPKPDRPSVDEIAAELDLLDGDEG